MNASVNTVGTLATASADVPARFVPEVLRVVTVPQLKMRPGMTIYVAIRAAMHKGTELRGKQPVLKDGEKPKEPPMLLDVVNLETGEMQQLIPGTILVDILNDSYPKESYVGKGFAITVAEQKSSAGGGGRRYNTYHVNEIKVPQALQPKKAA